MGRKIGRQAANKARRNNSLEENKLEEDRKQNPASSAIDTEELYVLWLLKQRFLLRPCVEMPPSKVENNYNKTKTKKSYTHTHSDTLLPTHANTEKKTE